MFDRFDKFLRRKEGYILLVVALITYLLSHYTWNKSEFTDLDSYYSQSLKWNSCYENFQCADLAVPIDYTNLSAGTFKISVLRYRAQEPKNRIGSLIVNPGGPGASGVDYAYNAEYLFDPDVLDRYDIVGFDPRGVSRSAPIHCFTNKEIDTNYASDSKPDSDAEFQQSLKDSQEFIDKCLAKNDHLTAYSTANAARDMDILRQALGDSKLNYMGKSYGTYMGALYASLFPTKIGRVVLDGAVDPTISKLDQIKTQAAGFDGALQSFIKDCISQKTCPLPRNQKAASAKLLAIWHGAATKPIPLKDKSDKRKLTESLLVLGTASALYDSYEGWPMLRKAISEVLDGYGDSYIQLADLYTGREKDGSYSNNDFDAGAIIDCLDFADSRTPQDIRRDAAAVAAVAPVFGPYIAYSGLTCKYLNAPKPVQVKATKTNATIVIIGTTGDPATPYAWAKGLGRLLTNSRLLTFVGDGHTGQGRGNACIDEAIDDFYLQGTLPTANLRCTD